MVATLLLFVITEASHTIQTGRGVWMRCGGVGGGAVGWSCSVPVRGVGAAEGPHNHKHTAAVTKPLQSVRARPPRGNTPPLQSPPHTLKHLFLWISHFLAESSVRGFHPQRRLSLPPPRLLPLCQNEAVRGGGLTRRMMMKSMKRNTVTRRNHGSDLWLRFHFLPWSCSRRLW